MPQGPLTAVTLAKNANGNYSATSIDATNNLAVQNGGIHQAYNVTSASVIKASPGRLRKVSFVSAGTSGSFVLNDATTVSGATSANEIGSFVFSSTVVGGGVLTLDWPCSAGITVSDVTSGGVVAVAYD